MSKIKEMSIENINEHYVDHEVRIRILEHLSKQINNKMNVALTLIIGSIVLPVGLKWLGWV